MSFKSENTCTRKENCEKCKIELEKLNKQNNKEQLSRCTTQPKFKMSFTTKINTSLDIHNTDLQLNLHITSHK